MGVKSVRRRIRKFGGHVSVPTDDLDDYIKWCVEGMKLCLANRSDTADRTFMYLHGKLQIALKDRCKRINKYSCVYEKPARRRNVYFAGGTKRG